MDLNPSAHSSVIVAFSSNYFSTLCEMLTNFRPSVWTSVIVHVKKDYICVTYLPSCKHLNDKLSIAQNNNNSA
jgi:hypothetical protein